MTLGLPQTGATLPLKGRTKYISCPCVYIRRCLGLVPYFFGVRTCRDEIQKYRSANELNLGQWICLVS
jgi:hypothetical protein